MTDSLLSNLTPREMDCLRGVAAHKRTKVIASELGLKDKTVDAYIASAARKLGCSDRDSAVRALIARDPEAWGFSPTGKTGVELNAGSAPGPWTRRLPWPFPTKERPINDLAYPGTITAVLIATSIMMAVASLYILAIRMLSEPL